MTQPAHRFDRLEGLCPELGAAPRFSPAIHFPVRLFAKAGKVSPNLENSAGGIGLACPSCRQKPPLETMEAMLLQNGSNLFSIFEHPSTLNSENS